MDKESSIISPAKVKEILEEEKKSRELNNVQNITLDHLKKYVKLSTDESNEMISELINLGYISEYYANKLTEIMPTTPDTVKSIFAKEKRFILEKEQIETILEIVDRYNK